MKPVRRMLLLLLLALGLTLMPAGRPALTVAAAPIPPLATAALPPATFTTLPQPVGRPVSSTERLVRQARIQLQAAVAAASFDQPKLLMLPWGVPSEHRATADWLWRYNNGSWNPLTPPQAGWYWYWIAADPKNGARWALLGSTTQPGLADRPFVITPGGVLKARGTTVSPLWITENAGVSWRQVNLTMPVVSPAYIQAEILQVEFDPTTGQLMLAGHVVRAPNASDADRIGATWQGPALATDPAPSLLGRVHPGWYRLDVLVPGMKTAGTPSDMIVLELDSPGPSTNHNGRYGFVRNGVLKEMAGGVWNGRKALDRRLTPDATQLYSAGAGSLWLDANYTLLGPAPDPKGILADSVESVVAVGTQGLYVSGNSPLPQGIVRVTTPFGTPKTRLVAASGSTMKFLRSDRGTQQVVAGIELNQESVHLYAETGQCVWPMIAPPRASLLRDQPDMLNPRVEIIAGAGVQFPQGYGQFRVPEDFPAAGAQPSRGSGVNTRSGARWTSVTDLAVETPGIPLAFTRSYSSDATCDFGTSLGQGWQHTFAARVIPAAAPGGEAIVLSPAGNRLRFIDKNDGTGQYTAARGITSVLMHTGTGTERTYTWTTRDQTQYIFNAAGRLQRVRNVHNQELALTYEPSNLQRLIKIADTTVPTRSLTLAYRSNVYDPRIESVSHTASNRIVRYFYDDDDPWTRDNNNDLVRVIDVMGRDTTYGYLNHALVEERNHLGQPLSTTIYDAHNPLGRVVEQRLPNDQVIRFDYVGLATTISRVDAAAPTVSLEEETLTFDAKGALASTAQDGRVVQQTTYDADWQLTRTVDGRSHGMDIGYTPGKLGLPQTVTRYDENQQPLVTTIFYNDKNQPKTLIELTGRTNASGTSLERKTTWTYTPANNYVQTMTTGSTAETPAGFTTTYRYQNNLKLRTVKAPDGVITCFDYDSLRQVVKQTVYAQDDPAVGQITMATPCPASTAPPATKAKVTRFSYTPEGWLKTRTDPLGTSITYAYFRNGALDERTEQYNRGDGTIIQRGTELEYDLVGRPIAVVDAQGRRSVTHYDASGRVAWTIENLAGTVKEADGQYAWQPYNPASPAQNVGTQYEYDAADRVVRVIEYGFLSASYTLPPSATFVPGFTTGRERVTELRYVTPLSDPTLEQSLSRQVWIIQNPSGQNPPTQDVADQDLITQTWYDLAGNVVRTIDPLNRETHFTYDARNQLVETVRNYQNGNPEEPAGVVDQDLRTLLRYTPGGELATMIANATAPFPTEVAYDPLKPDLNRTTTYAYQGPGWPRLTTVNNVPGAPDQATDLNQVTEIRYDLATGRALGTKDALGRWTHYGYDGFGRLTSTCLNAQTEPGTSGFSCSQRSQNDQNVPWRLAYDVMDRVIARWDPLQQRMASSYDGLGQLLTTVENAIKTTAPITDQNVMVERTYDTLGRLTSETRPESGTATVPPTTYSYNNATGVVTVKDPQGLVVRMGYDGRGTLRWTECVSCIETTTASGSCVVLTSTTAKSRWTNYVVDRLGRTTQVVETYVGGPITPVANRTDNLITTMRYDKGGRVTEQVDHAGMLTRYAYDWNDNLTAVQENVQASCPDDATDCNSTTRYTYDRMGNRTSIQDPRAEKKLTEPEQEEFRRHMAYDAADRLTTETDPLDQVTRYEYDRLNRLEWKRSPRGDDQHLHYSYTGLDQVSEVTWAGGGKRIRAEYDLLGRQTGQWDEREKKTTMGYDALSRITSVTAPEAGLATTTTSYTYTRRGERLGMTYPSGTKVSYGYQADGLLTRVLTAQTGTTAQATYAYLKDGRLKSVTRANKTTTTYCYDAAGRLAEILTKNTSGVQLSRFVYTWERDGLLHTVSATFGSGGGGATPTKTSVAASATSTAARTATKTRTPTKTHTATRTATRTRTATATLSAGQRTATAYCASKPEYCSAGIWPRQARNSLAGGASQTPTATLTPPSEPSIPGEERLVTVTAAPSTDIGAADPTGPRIADESTAREPAQPAAVSSVLSQGYSYDDLHRLTSATQNGTTSSYTYDAAGNRLTAVEQGRLRNWAYNGANQVSNDGWQYDADGNLTNDGTASYTYNALGLLTDVLTAQGRTSYHYDADGTLIARERNGDGDLETPGQTSWYRQDLAASMSEVLEVIEQGTTTTAVYGLERLFSTNTTNLQDRQWVVTDLLGTQRQTLTNVGAQLATANYDAWGQAEGGNTSGLFGFTGELQDTSTDLLNLRARWYHPETGRFLTQDPFAGWATTPASLHPYLYGANNPIMNRDPSGMICIASWVPVIGQTSCKAYTIDALSEKPQTETGQFLRGFGKRGVDTVKGIASLASRQTWAAVGRGVKRLWNDPSGSYRFLKHNFDKGYTQMKRGAEFLADDPQKALGSITAEEWGGITFDIISTYYGARGIYRAGAMRQVASESAVVTTAREGAVVDGITSTRSRLMANIEASREANRVSGFTGHVQAENSFRSILAAKNEADVARGIIGRTRPNNTTGITHTSGRSFSGPNIKGNTRPTYVQEVEDALVIAQREVQAQGLQPNCRLGFCSEPGVISSMIEAKLDPRGAIGHSVKVRYMGQGHGTYLPACDYCQVLYRIFGIAEVQ